MDCTERNLENNLDLLYVFVIGLVTKAWTGSNNRKLLSPMTACY